MDDERPDTRAATKRYRPFGIAGSVGGGLVASALFKRLWLRFAPGDQDRPPSARDTDYRVPEIVVAAMLQGALYAVVKTAIDRSGAHAFKRVTGTWPDA